MRVTYDSAVDAAYVQFAESIGAGGVEVTVACDPAEVGGMIHLDFDAQGVLVGMEILGASHKLPAELLDHASRRGRE